MDEVLVTGASGNVGGSLLGQLAAAGHPVRALVRREVDLPDAVTAVRGDLTDPGSLDDALDGVDRVFLVWPDDAAPAPVVARLAGRRVVYLSAHGVSVDDDPILRGHAQLEALVREHAAEWTLLRGGGFASNTLHWAEQVRSGVVRWPYAGAARSLVHEEDIAAVAALALTTDDLLGATPHLTGPQVLTQAEQVAVIAEVVGHPVRFEELPRDAAHVQMLGWGWPEERVDGALDAWADMVGRPEVVSPDVPRLLGRPARTFARWAADHAAAFT